MPFGRDRINLFINPHHGDVYNYSAGERINVYSYISERNLVYTYIHGAIR